MTILNAAYGDLQAILSLQYLAYQSEARLVNNFNIPPLRQTLEEVRRELFNGVILKAVDDAGIIVGSVRGYEDAGTLYIGKLITHPDWQGQGIGSQLLHAIESMYPQARYELFTGSKSVQNIRFYQKRGYTAFKEKVISPALTLVYMEKHCRNV